MDSMNESVLRMSALACFKRNSGHVHNAPKFLRHLYDGVIFRSFSSSVMYFDRMLLDDTRIACLGTGCRFTRAHLRAEDVRDARQDLLLGTACARDLSGPACSAPRNSERAQPLIAVLCFCAKTVQV